MDRAEAIKGIHKAAKRRKKADEAKREATDDLRRYCAAAKEVGVPVSQIASEADLSRQGVYDLLAEQH